MRRRREAAFSFKDNQLRLPAPANGDWQTGMARVRLNRSAVGRTRPVASGRKEPESEIGGRVASEG